MISDEDVERIADAITPRLIAKVKDQKHDFWIDPEQHYKDHQKMEAFDNNEIYDLKGLVAMYRATRSLWFKAFIGFAIIGAIALAAVGVGLNK